MRNKKPNYLTIIIIILTIIVGIIFGYMYYQEKQLDTRINTKEKSNKSKKKYVDIDEEEEEIGIDSDIVKQVETTTAKIGHYAKYTNYDVKNLTKRNLIDTALNGLSNDQITFCVTNRTQLKTSITIEDFNKSLNKYIPNVTLTTNDLIENKGQTSLKLGDYGYDSYSLIIEDKNIYVISGCDGRGPGLLAETIVESPVKAVTKGDYLYVYRKVAFGKYKGTGYDYYKNLEKTEFVETLGLNDKPVWDKYNTYKSTYELVDATYYLVSSVKE